MKRGLLVLTVLVLGFAGVVKLTAEEPPPIPDDPCCLDPITDECSELQGGSCDPGEVLTSCPCTKNPNTSYND